MVSTAIGARRWSVAAVVSALAVLAGACGGGDGGGTVASGPTTTTGPGPNTISGRVSYAGGALDGHSIVIAVNRQGEQGAPAYSTKVGAPGAYTIDEVTDGSYTIIAFIDLGDDMGAPKANEPAGSYDPGGDGQPDVFVMSGGAPLTDIDVVLKDPG